MYNGGTYGGYKSGYKSDYKSGYKSSRHYGEYGSPKRDIYNRPLRYDATTNYYSKPNPYATYERPPDPQYIPPGQIYSSPHGQRGRGPRAPGRGQSQSNPLCDTKIIALIVGTILFMACIGIIVWVAIPDSKKEATVSVIVQATVTIKGDFVSELRDPTSTEFKAKEKEVCDILLPATGAASCNVLRFRNGSIIIDFELEKRIPVSENTDNSANDTATEFQMAIQTKVVDNAAANSTFNDATIDMIMANVQKVCPPGKTGSPCANCPVDTYKDQMGAGSCTFCADGKTTNGTGGATAASACVIPPPPDMSMSESISPSPTVSDNNAGGSSTMDMSMAASNTMDVNMTMDMGMATSSPGDTGNNTVDMSMASSSDAGDDNNTATVNDSVDPSSTADEDSNSSSSMDEDGNSSSMDKGDNSSSMSMDEDGNSSSMDEGDNSSSMSMDEDGNSSSMDEDDNSSSMSMDEGGNSSSMDEDDNSSSMSMDEGGNSSSMDGGDNSSSMSMDEDDSSSSMDMDNSTSSDAVDPTTTEDDMMSSTAG